MEHVDAAQSGETLFVSEISPEERFEHFSCVLEASLGQADLRQCESGRLKIWIQLESTLELLRRAGRSVVCDEDTAEP